MLMSLMSNFAESVEVPAWVRWLAQDSDGTWWGYSVEPLRNDNGWYENEVGRRHWGQSKINSVIAYATHDLFIANPHHQARVCVF